MYVHMHVAAFRGQIEHNICMARHASDMVINLRLYVLATYQSVNQSVYVPCLQDLSEESKHSNWENDLP